ncbi:hypothetical protein QE364_000161 [Nocardioides zeae]|uniref:Uncharacterized protein n=1 Tax=Nocardioides zeae TaxID=1457234 RepID=A0ACC6ICM1_9ACTN|nr:hypothetical protein [Nocardioides zeae]MDR6175542.1 hypothetical protein [Nocardioides zeae]MDR6208473.1 hypothetical protein [Nocardioides zeae]
MGDVTTARRIGGLVLYVVGCALVAGATAPVVAAADRGDLPLWGLVLAVALLAAAVALLALLAGRLAGWWLTSNAMNPYGLPEHLGLARAGGAFFVVMISLMQPLVALDVSSRTRWVVGGLLVAVASVFAGFAWPAGRAQRRRVRDARRQRGYRLGEQPWSWGMHATFAVVFAVVGVSNLGATLTADGWDAWVFAVGAALGLGFGAGVGWSAVQKWRREHRGVTRAGRAA